MVNNRISLSRLVLNSVFGESKKPIKLLIQARKGYPRFTVWLPDDPGKEVFERVITVPFTFKEMMNIPVMIDSVANDTTGEEQYEIISYNNEYTNNTRTENVVPVGKTIIKRNDNGIITIILEAVDRPKVSFPILPDPKYFKMIKNGIEITSHKKMSEIHAKAYAKTLQLVIGNLVTQYSLENDRQELEN